MTTSAEPYDETVVRDLGGLGRTVVREDELLRHTTYTRSLHWAVAILFSALMLLATGVQMGFPVTTGRLDVAIRYVLHHFSALIVLGLVFVHLCLSAIGPRGTLRAMTRGVVPRTWAWTHHPGL